VLRRDDLDWAALEIFWGDERSVPPEDPQSNYRMARETLLSLVPIPAANVHRWPAELAPENAANAYEEELDRRLGNDGLDLVFLGIGDDGHTASLFPGTAALEVRDRRAAANFVPAFDRWRLTLTYVALEAARAVLFLVEGQAKAPVVRRLKDGEDLPASRVRSPETIWLLDRAAAGDTIP